MRSSAAVAVVGEELLGLVEARERGGAVAEAGVRLREVQGDAVLLLVVAHGAHDAVERGRAARARA